MEEALLLTLSKDIYSDESWRSKKQWCSKVKDSYFFSKI